MICSNTTDGSPKKKGPGKKKGKLDLEGPSKLICPVCAIRIRYERDMLDARVIRM